jgi:predicted ribosome quality control (RQC) complex YloA/Tae2 family protein
MVFYYTSLDGHIIYKGKDKYENEDLIKYGWEEDVWFHVDDLSSAHVYLRLK